MGGSQTNILDELFFYKKKEPLSIRIETDFRPIEI